MICARRPHIFPRGPHLASSWYSIDNYSLINSGLLKKLKNLVKKKTMTYFYDIDKSIFGYLDLGV